MHCTNSASVVFTRPRPISAGSERRLQRWLSARYTSGVDRVASVALESVGLLEAHQATASPSFLKSDPDR